MHTKSLFNFDYSYLSLPDNFYNIVKPGLFNKAQLFIINKELCADLNVSITNPDDFIALLFKEQSQIITKSFAQAYAGHQFGHFTKLGDGRALIIGEHINKKNRRFDIQLKGSGKTIYSRGGDGQATLRAMLREYLISEAVHYLNIPSSRSLAVINTKEPVFRETLNQGAILVRTMKSHIRIGTFEYAAHFCSPGDLKALTKYTIKRLYPDIEHDQNPALSLLIRVMTNQIKSVAAWMGVGFIHGVMNTDNTSISGETFDYGPCAFMNVYNPDTVFSSIDKYGRYAFKNQGPIIKWNIARFAEALLLMIHSDKKESLHLAQGVIDSFDSIWNREYYGIMCKKLGFESNNPQLYGLTDEFLSLLKNNNMDYTNAFRALCMDINSQNNLLNIPQFQDWLKKWKNSIDNSRGMQKAKNLMKKHNPLFIPRNHLVEQALDQAVNNNPDLFKKLLNLSAHPFQYKSGSEEFTAPPKSDFDITYQTFCGT